MTVGLIYLTVAIIGIVLAAIAYTMNRTSGKFFVAFTLMEIVIMAIIGVINGVLGTPNANAPELRLPGIDLSLPRAPENDRR